MLENEFRHGEELNMAASGGRACAFQVPQNGQCLSLKIDPLDGAVKSAPFCCMLSGKQKESAW